MTLVELAATMSILALLLYALVRTADHLRSEDAQRQTRQTLHLLYQAMLRYHRDHHRWLEGPTDHAIAALLSDPVTAPMLSQLDVNFDDPAHPLVRDGFGHPIHYIAPFPGQWQQPDFVAGSAATGQSARLDELSNPEPEAIPGGAPGIATSRHGGHQPMTPGSKNIFDFGIFDLRLKAKLTDAPAPKPTDAASSRLPWDSSLAPGDAAPAPVLQIENRTPRNALRGGNQSKIGNHRAAFSLLEMLMVVSIIVILVAILLGGAFASIRWARVRQTQATIGVLDQICYEYYQRKQIYFSNNSEVPAVNSMPAFMNEAVAVVGTPPGRATTPGDIDIPKALGASLYDETSVWQCASAHTSTYGNCPCAGQSSPLAPSQPLWINVGPAWANAVNFTVGQYVGCDNAVFQCVASNQGTDQPFPPAYPAYGNRPGNTAYWSPVPGAGVWAPGTAYAVNALVMMHVYHVYDAWHNEIQVFNYNGQAPGQTAASNNLRPWFWSFGPNGRDDSVQPSSPPYPQPTWTLGTSYTLGTVVQAGSALWTCANANTAANANGPGVTDTSNDQQDWRQGGLGGLPWSANPTTNPPYRNYQPYDAVGYNGAIWFCIQAPPGTGAAYAPGNTTYWQQTDDIRSAGGSND